MIIKYYCHQCRCSVKQCHQFVISHWTTWRMNEFNEFNIYNRGCPVADAHPSLMTGEDSNNDSGCMTKTVGLMQTEHVSKIQTPEEPKWTQFVIRKQFNTYRLVVVNKPQRSHLSQDANSVLCQVEHNYN